MDTDGTAKMADYGYTILLHPLLRKICRGEGENRPFWIAPENLRGTCDKVETRSDIWGIGAFMIELITSHPPYWEETQGDLDKLKRLLKTKSKFC